MDVDGRVLRVVGGRAVLGLLVPRPEALDRSPRLNQRAVQCEVLAAYQTGSLGPCDDRSGAAVCLLCLRTGRRGRRRSREGARRPDRPPRTRPLDPPRPVDTRCSSPWLAGVSHASLTTSHRVAAVTRAGRPLRGWSYSVITRPSAAKRRRHVRTVSTWQPTLRPISAFDSPWEASRMILARSTSRASTRMLRAIASSSSRTGGARRSRCAFGRGMPMRSFSRSRYSRALTPPYAWIQDQWVRRPLEDFGPLGTSRRLGALVGGT